MNKKLIALREAQAALLENLRAELITVNAASDEAFCAIPSDISEAERHALFAANVMPLCNKARDIEKQIENLEIDILPKKYAMHIGYSDVNPFEVIEEKTENCYVIREMNAVETEASREARMKSFIPGGFVGHFDNNVQDWVITPDTSDNAYIVTIRRHKDGYFYGKGGRRYSIEAAPRKVYDFNF